jgi:adenosylcobinamide-phosphate synthase
MFALAVDALAGEPPTAFHPTAWMGRAINDARRQSRGERPHTALASGTALSVAGIAMTAAAAYVCARGIERLPDITRAAAEGVALKPTMSVRALLAAGKSVERALAQNRLDVARRRLAFHLVSRHTVELAPHEVAGAAISSLAENLSDALVAPLMAYCVGGLPAAYVYRFINTADAMLGYRTRELEWFGKASARVDDAANLIPARVTACLIALAAPMVGGSARRAMRTAFSDARRTASPNAGWPMAAMSGALDVTLGKRGSYTLNTNGRRPTANDIARARRVIAITSILAGLVAEAACASRA